MKLFLSAVAVLSILSSTLVSGQSEPTSGALTGEESEALASRIMKDVLSRLPKRQLLINGNITVRKRRGVVTQKLKFELEADWGSRPASASYTIRDSFGSSLEKLTLVRVQRSLMTAYMKGDPLAQSTPPDLSKIIQETDISWLDLTLSFLWWDGGRVVGTEKIKGRNCYVIEIPAPRRSKEKKDEEEAVNKSAQYGKVRIWVDEEIRMLLQAEGYGADGNLMRKLWIKSFKKIKETWMIKDMEVQEYPAVHRTKLQIREVNVTG